MKNLQRNVAIQIRALRKERHMQQTDLAALVGVTRTSISNIERNKQAVSLTLFCKIAQALDYRPGELLDMTLNKRASVSVSKKDVLDPKIRKLIKEAIQ